MKLFENFFVVVKYKDTYLVKFSKFYHDYFRNYGEILYPILTKSQFYRFYVIFLTAVCWGFDNFSKIEK